jgi:hypothetical protein
MNMTSKLSAATVSVCLLLVAGCDDNAQKTPPTTTGAVGPAPVVEAKPVADRPAEVAVAKPTMLTVLDRPASQWTIDGKSVSRATDAEVLEAAKKAGWTKDDTTVTPLIGGQYEARSFPIEKGKTKGTVKIVRPTATPGTADSMSGFTPPSTLGASMSQETTAFTYDADSDVFVGVDLTEGGKAADAKKILDTLVVKSKTPIEGRGIVTAGTTGTTGSNDMAGSAAAGTAGAPGTKTGTAAPNAAGNDGSHNTKDSNTVVPTTDGKANSAARKPEKDSNSIPPKPTSH